MDLMPTILTLVDDRCVVIHIVTGTSIHEWSRSDHVVIIGSPHVGLNILRLW